MFAQSHCLVVSSLSNDTNLSMKYFNIGKVDK